MSEAVMTKTIIPVILCGGAGSRLWPASRETFPKQLCAFNGERSLLQATLDRVAGEAFAAPIIVTSHEHRFLVAEQLRGSACADGGDIMLEPLRRDSCAAIAAAAFHAITRDEEALLLVLAADHAIPDTAAFVDHVMRGVRAALEGHLVTFGVRPRHAATGYGYISPGAAIPGADGVHRVASFVEKPDGETALRYVEQGYLWNSGNFLFQAKAFLQELEALEPQIHGPIAKAVSGASRDLDFLRLEAEAFAGARSISVDYAVMQRTARAAVVPSDFQWSDIGSWSAVWDEAIKDDRGNAAQGDAVFHDCSNAYVHSQHMLTAVVGLDDVAVITTRDAVLVTAKARAEGVKQLVADLVKQGRREATEHTRSYRPWGDYEQIDRGTRYQVKRITVKPGGKLSLQSHVHRAEHWIVVSGTARVTVGETVHLLTENQSIYIPLGAIHRMENPGQIPLELIEVQSGSYLGEDDIIRYEDVYNRQ
jgi:mannose-1-phosphate guanylyltransferase / mannose-6-phosphate isomerase